MKGLESQFGIGLYSMHNGKPTEDFRTGEWFNVSNLEEVYKMDLEKEN
jgi:hypothetical protein